MSATAHHNALSMDREFRYILQWFGEWSDIQREDFVPVLLECLECRGGDGGGGPLVNGALAAGLAGATLADAGAGKPMSLFQCRVSGYFSFPKRAYESYVRSRPTQVKLFREWSAKWPADLKHKLREKCQQIDAEWSDRFASELAAIERSAGVANGFPNAAAAAADADDAEPGAVDAAAAAHLANGVAAAAAEHHAVEAAIEDNDDAGGDADALSIALNSAAVVQLSSPVRGLQNGGVGGAVVSA